MSAQPLLVTWRCTECDRHTQAALETVSARTDQFVAGGPVYFTDDGRVKFQKCPGCGANLHRFGERA